MCLTTTRKEKQQEEKIWVLSNQYRTNSETGNMANDLLIDYDAGSRNAPYDYSDYENAIPRNLSHHINYREENLAKTKGGGTNKTSTTTNNRINDLHQAGTMAQSIYQVNQVSPLDNIISNTEQNNIRAVIAAPSATSTSSTEAISLPLSHISRTQSEMQLCENIAAAEWRDNCMFHRLVNGIKETQAKRLQRRNTSNYSSNADSADFLHVCEQQQNHTDRRIERRLGNIVRHRCEDLHHNASPFDDRYNMDSSLQQSYPTPYWYGESNVIEPDEEDTLLFDMDDF